LSTAARACSVLLFANVEKLDGVLDIVNSLAQKHVAVLWRDSSRRVLAFLNPESSLGLLQIIKGLLGGENPLIGVILHLCQEGLSSALTSHRILPVAAAYTGLANGFLFVSGGYEGQPGSFSRSMTCDAVHIRHEHEAGESGTPIPPVPR